MAQVVASGSRLLYISTKPEPDTKGLHKQYRQYDSRVRAHAVKLAKAAPNAPPPVVMIDSYGGFKDLGNPNSLYNRDRLHLSNKGYAKWEKWAKLALADPDSLCIEWRSGTCVQLRPGP
jgi:lysophospholipase L1-like esterase